MSRRHVVTFLTAPARSGKSFNETRRICDEILSHDGGMIYTNLPLHVDAISEWSSERYGVSEESLRERLHIIPREVETEWMNAGQPIYDAKSGRKVGNHPITGPWEYFSDKQLANATIIIDEIHNFCGTTGTLNSIAQLWSQWLGELGHNQAVFRCLSQAPEKVHKCIKQEAQAYYTIRNTGLDRDPYFKIELYDWLELWAGLFGGSYRVFVFEQEIQKAEGRSRKGERKLHLMGPPYFDFYDSFNKPIAHEQTAGVKPFEHEYEKHLRKGAIRGRVSLLWWFFRKNMYNLVSRTAFLLGIVGILVFLTLGGAGGVMRSFYGSVTRAMKKTEASGTAENGSAGSAAEAKGPARSEGRNVVDERERIEQIRKTYEDELRKALLEKEKATVELEKLRKEFDAMSAVVMMTPECVVLKKGHRYEVGEEIDFGEYRGRRLERIDYRRREAILDGGVVLRMSE